MGKRVLVVDDSAMARALVRRVLEGAGHATTIVPDADSALTALATARFDVAVIDMVMPDMDGPSLCTTIRSALGPAAPRLVLLTSADLNADRRALIGADAYAPKDASLGALLEAVG